MKEIYYADYLSLMAGENSACACAKTVGVDYNVHIMRLVIRIPSAENTAIVVVAKFGDELVQNCNETIHIVKTWLKSVGLDLAEHMSKTEL